MATYYDYSKTQPLPTASAPTYKGGSGNDIFSYYAKARNPNYSPYSETDLEMLNNASPYGSFVQDSLNRAYAGLNKADLNPAAMAAARQRLSNQFMLKAGQTALPVWESLKAAQQGLKNQASQIPTTSNGAAMVNGLVSGIKTYAPYVAAAYAGGAGAGGRTAPYAGMTPSETNAVYYGGGW
jgi:hypothetical protein